jgi:hypothetical protein
VTESVRFVELITNVLWFSDSGIFKDNAIIGDATTLSNFEEIFERVKQLISNGAACMDDLEMKKERAKAGRK